jgi:hypothetical protein
MWRSLINLKRVVLMEGESSQGEIMTDGNRRIGDSEVRQLSQVWLQRKHEIRTMGGKEVFLVFFFFLVLGIEPRASLLSHTPTLK